MAQTFNPHMTLIGRVILYGLPVVSIALGALAVYGDVWSPWRTHEDWFVDQAVPFSHEHHVKGLGLDCRFCHASADQSSFAGMPATKTCMTCHSQIWQRAAMLAPVRESWASGEPLVWQRVHDLPAYVYFDHSIHVQKGVGCTTCHGQVDTMPLMRRATDLQMRWCLSCHRDPEQYLRPRDRVFDVDYAPPKDQRALGDALAKAYHVRSAEQITNCSMCHR